MKFLLPEIVVLLHRPHFQNIFVFQFHLQFDFTLFRVEPMQFDPLDGHLTVAMATAVNDAITAHAQDVLFVVGRPSFLAQRFEMGRFGRGLGHHFNLKHLRG